MRDAQAFEEALAEGAQAVEAHWISSCRRLTPIPQ